jgi:hypothetical protein
MDQAENDKWNQWATTVCNQQIAAAWERHWDFCGDVIAQVIAEERNIHRAELRRQIADAIRELRAELNEQRARDAGQIIDMPSPLVRKVHNGKAA